MSAGKHTQAQMDSLRIQVEQLRVEAGVPRKRISEAAREYVFHRSNIIVAVLNRNKLFYDFKFHNFASNLRNI